MFSTDRKALQVFTPSTGTWSYPGAVPTNIFDASDYTVNRLPNGRILYSGGNWTTGNGANQQCYITNLTALGLEEITEADLFSVYPVPAKGQLTVACEKEVLGNGYSFLLSNTLGQVIYTIPVNNELTSIDLQNLTQSGIYFVSLKNDLNEIVQTRKIIVE